MNQTLERQNRFSIYPLCKGYRASENIKELLDQHDSSWFIREMIAIVEHFKIEPIIYFKLTNYKKSTFLDAFDGVKQSKRILLLEEKYPKFEPRLPDQKILYFKTGRLFMTAEEFDPKFHLLESGIIK